MDRGTSFFFLSLFNPQHRDCAMTEIKLNFAAEQTENIVCIFPDVCWIVLLSLSSSLKRPLWCSHSPVHLCRPRPQQCESWAWNHLRMWRLSHGPRKAPWGEDEPCERHHSIYTQVYFPPPSCQNGHPLTWGTHECQSRWRSPWAGQISSCVSWWRPWRGSQIHRYPERPPAPSELQPQPTASWRRKKALLVTVVMSHSNNNICDCSRILTPTSSSCTSQTSLTSHPGSRFYLLHLLRHKDSGWWVIRELKIDLWFERCTYTTLVSNSVTAFD